MEIKQQNEHRTGKTRIQKAYHPKPTVPDRNKPVPSARVKRRPPGAGPPPHNRHNTYNGTSVAYDYAEEEAPGYLPQRSKLVRRLVKKSLVFVYKDGTNQKLSVFLILTIIFIFLGAFSLAISYANLYDKQQQVSKLTAELKTMKQENDSLQLEISESFDKDEIERIAKERLRMINPKPYQIIHINVPRNNYVVLAGDNPKTNQSEGFVESVKGIIVKVQALFSSIVNESQ